MSTAMEWVKHKADTLIIIVTVVTAALWMNNSISDIQKDMAVLKTILILKGIMPTDLAHGDK